MVRVFKPLRAHICSCRAHRPRRAACTCGSKPRGRTRPTLRTERRARASGRRKRPDVLWSRGERWRGALRWRGRRERGERWTGGCANAERPGGDRPPIRTPQPRATPEHGHGRPAAWFGRKGLRRRPLFFFSLHFVRSFSVWRARFSDKTTEKNDILRLAFFQK